MGATQWLRANRNRTRTHIASSAGPARIRALGFDFDHTLGLDNKLERVAFLHLIEFIERDGGAPLGALDAEIVRIDELLAHQRAGACTIDDAVERFVRDRGVAPTGYADEYRRIALASVDAFVVPLPGARDCFEHLRARAVPHAILTNGWAPLQQRKAARIGFGGAVLASSEIGSQKPDAAAFAALARALGCEADGIGYIGDNPVVDVAGALAAGMQGIWLDAEGASYPSTVPGPSRVIHSLHEVLALVRP